MWVKNFKQYMQLIKEEAIIQNYDFNPFFEKLKNINSFDELKELSDQFNIVFATYDEFHNDYLDTEEERKIAPPKEMKIMSYLKFALYSRTKDKYVIVVEDEFYNDFKETKKALSDRSFKSLLHEILNHESIHKEQDIRSGGKSYDLTRSPSKPKEYFSHYTEIMAYARSTVDQMLSKGYTKEEMLSDLRRNRLDSWIPNIYNQMDPATMKRYRKYVYEYIQSL